MSRPPAGGSRSERTTPQPSPTQPYPGMQPPIQRTSPREIPMSHPVLPPLRQLSSTPPTPSGQRYADPFRQILNPQQELREQERNRRRSASQMDSPSPVETSQPQSLPSISRPSSAELTQDDHLPRTFHPPGRPGPRHMLDAKSPRLHRTQSLNLLNPPTGTIDAHQSPFLTASTRPSESVLSHQSLPTPPAAGRHSYFPAMPTTGPALPHSMARTDLRRPSMGVPQSGSASPIAQYSPYSQPGSVASSQFDTPSTPGHHPNRQPSVQMQETRLSAGPMDAERNMIPMAPSPQSSIQLMTIKSQHGHNVQIPVDVQAASKVADEKRRRNAGASARFRARRKEKEREASISISRLEQQLRDALEDAEFYRGERDYFRAIVFSQPRPERLSATRPQSPRLRRSSIPPSNATSSIRGGSEDSFADYEEEIREEERNVRRRTSNYRPASGPPPRDISAPEARSQNYPPGYPPTNQVSQGVSPVHQYPGREQMQPGQPIYRDQYGQDKGRYENNNWTPPQGQPRET